MKPNFFTDRFRKMTIAIFIVTGSPVVIHAQTKGETALKTTIEVFGAIETGLEQYEKTQTAIPGAAPATLRLHNNTDKEIYAAYAIYDRNTKCWISNGWFKVPPDGETNINLGNYVGNVYISGKQHTYMGLGNDIVWGRDSRFCVNKDNAFNITYANQISCNNRAVFSKFHISAGINRWTFNP